MTSTREQQLIDICFQCVGLASDPESYKRRFSKMTHTERMAWVAKQLRECGFDTEPIGASWGVLKT